MRHEKTDLKVFVVVIPKEGLVFHRTFPNCLLFIICHGHLIIKKKIILLNKIGRHFNILGIITQDLQEKSEEYRIEADRISGILTGLGLSTDSLSQSGQYSFVTSPGLDSKKKN